MTPDKELKLFAHIGGYNEFLEWLDRQHEDAVKYLVEARDPVAIHRAQGKALFVADMKKLVSKARELR
jgi:hypothetical protein